MLRSRNSQASASANSDLNQDNKKDKMSIEKLKKLVMDNFPEAELKVSQTLRVYNF